MKTLILLLILTALITFNWDKVPTPVKKAMWGVKSVAGNVYEKGLDMPAPVKKYVDTTIAPKAKKLKEKFQ